MLVDGDVFKEQLGGIQSALNFKTILPFVRAATREMMKLIGKELLAELEAATDEGELAELKYYAQGYVSWLAYHKAMPHLKFRVGDLGIMKTSPANTVAITKWEYVDTMEGSLNMADGCLESFFELLEDLKPDTWKESDAYKVRNGLYINSPQILGKYVVLAGKNVRFFSQLAVYIAKADELYIAEVITEEVNDSLKAKLQDASAVWTALEKKLLEHIRKALAPLAIREAAPFLQLKIDEEGMREIRKKDGIKEEEIAAKGYRNRHLLAVDAESELYLNKLRKFMDENASVAVWPSYWNANKALATEMDADFTDRSHVIL
jgi:hypothetical protein